MNVHVEVGKSTNNVVVNSLFYKGLRKFKSQKNGKKWEKKAKCLQNVCKKLKCLQTNAGNPYK